MVIAIIDTKKKKPSVPSLPGTPSQVGGEQLKSTEEQNKARDLAERLKQSRKGGGGGGGGSRSTAPPTGGFSTVEGKEVLITPSGQEVGSASSGSKSSSISRLSRSSQTSQQTSNLPLSQTSVGLYSSTGRIVGVQNYADNISRLPTKEERALNRAIIYKPQNSSTKKILSPSGALVGVEDQSQSISRPPTLAEVQQSIRDNPPTLSQQDTNQLNDAVNEYRQILNNAQQKLNVEDVLYYIPAQQSALYSGSPIRKQTLRKEIAGPEPGKPNFKIFTPVNPVFLRKTLYEERALNKIQSEIANKQAELDKKYSEGKISAEEYSKRSYANQYAASQISSEFTSITGEYASKTSGAKAFIGGKALAIGATLPILTPFAGSIIGKQGIEGGKEIRQGNIAGGLFDLGSAALTAALAFRLPGRIIDKLPGSNSRIVNFGKKAADVGVVGTFGAASAVQQYKQTGNLPFALGFGAGSIAPFAGRAIPLRVQTLEIPTKTEPAKFKLVGLETERGRALVIASKTPDGFSFGRPKVSSYLKDLPQGTEIKIGSALETATLKKALADVSIKPTERARQAIPLARDVLRRAQFTKSKYTGDIPKQTERLNEQGVKVLVNIAKENKGVIFGSFSRDIQLAREYKIPTQTSTQVYKLNKVPRDIDIRFDTADEIKLKEITDKAILDLKKAGIEAREVKDTPFAIEAKSKGEYVKIAEFKGGDNKLEGEEVPEFVVGFRKVGTPITVEKVKVTPLSEELRGVAQGVLRIRKTSKGEIDIFPSPKRTKDIGSFSVSARTLAESKLMNRKLSRSIEKFESLFPEKLVREQVKRVLNEPEKIKIVDFSPSKVSQPVRFKAPPLVVYHSTTDKFIKDILKSGLKPSYKTNVYQGVAKPSSFVSTGLSVEATKGFGMRAAIKSGGKPVTLKAVIPSSEIPRLRIESDKLTGVGEIRFTHIPKKFLSVLEESPPKIKGQSDLKKAVVEIISSPRSRPSSSVSRSPRSISSFSSPSFSKSISASLSKSPSQSSSQSLSKSFSGFSPSRSSSRSTSRSSSPSLSPSVSSQSPSPYYPRTTNKNRRRPFTFDFGSKKDKKQVGIQGFRTFFVRAGKEIFLPGIREKGAALRFGEQFTLKNLRAQFGVKPTKFSVEAKPTNYQVRQDLFRPYKIRQGKPIQLTDRYIQKRSKRLSTPGEISEIFTAKRRASK